MRLTGEVTDRDDGQMKVGTVTTNTGGTNTPNTGTGGGSLPMSTAMAYQ